MSLIDNTKVEPYEMWYNFDLALDYLRQLDTGSQIVLETNWLIPQLTDTLTTYEQLNFGAVGTLAEKKSFYEDEKASF